MAFCNIHRVNYNGMVCPQCALGGIQQRAARQQQQVAQVQAQTVNNLPLGATLALQARVGQENFVAVPTGADLFIPLGTQVEFKAVATGAVVPINFAAAAWSGTAGANGSAATKTVTFNAASPAKNSKKTVIVTFSGKTVTVQCVVYTLTANSVPADNFGGHSATDLGVDERTSLSFATTPAGITALEAGGLKWTLVSTSGRKKGGIVQKAADSTSAPVEDGLGYYIAPYETGDAPAPATKAVQLRLAVCNGPIKGAGVDKSFTVHLPIAHMKKRANSDKHIQNYASAGFLGEIYFFPKTVSFRTLRFREAGGVPDHNGPFSTQTWADRTHKPTTFEGQAGHDIKILGGNSATGCPIEGSDSIYSGRITYTVPAMANNATEVGKYTWPIYWQYKPEDVEGAAYIRFQIAYHVATMYQSGRMVMYKGHDPALNCAECTARTDKAYGAATTTPF